VVFNVATDNAMVKPPSPDLSETACRTAVPAFIPEAYHFRQEAINLCG